MSRFIFYRNTAEVKLIEDILDLPAKTAETGNKTLYMEVFSRLFEMAAFAGFEGDLWHRLLTEALVYDENAYTIACERRRAPESLWKAASPDMEIFFELFALDIDEYLSDVVPDGLRSLIKDYSIKDRDGRSLNGIKYNPVIQDTINKLAVALAGEDTALSMRSVLENFYESFGLGKFGLHKAFRVNAKDMGYDVEIYPIYNIAVTGLDDLVGCEFQKASLRENTENFLMGRSANNCLLYGDAGTGKSSSIRAILNEYYKDGLRMIEVYKHQYREINSLIDTLKNRNYHFIIYMDDLSFEEFEVEYKYLKAVLEGGLESRPDNVLIYATSNRRHLVRENYTDREEGENDKHSAETVQEKLSLYARFGLSLYFGAPAQDEYYEIVDALALRYGISMDEKELHLQASRWALSRSGFSGRTASQFIDHLRGIKNV
ncbi:MAG: ATP-binding protein [Lachnospiraceae bacterium]|nr:ATP-binding protein [Lachnospiraceae bacterium]